MHETLRYHPRITAATAGRRRRRHVMRMRARESASDNLDPSEAADVGGGGVGGDCRVVSEMGDVENEWLTTVKSKRHLLRTDG